MSLPSGYENIKLNDDKFITIEEIRTTEKVLKTCAVVENMSITDFDIIEVLKRTTNVLRYFNNEIILNLQYPSYHNDMHILCICHGKLVIVDVTEYTMCDWENTMSSSFEVIRLAQQSDKYPHVNIYGRPIK